MKVGGVTITPPNEELLVLPRNPEPLVFRAKAVNDMSDFDALCPTPKPPGILTKDGWVPQTDDPDFKQVQRHYDDQQLAYLVIRTLEPSAIEWEHVNVSNPKTWGQWRKELFDAGLTKMEVNRVLQLVMDANSLNEAKLAKAREVFLLGQQQAAEKSSGQPAEQPST